MSTMLEARSLHKTFGATTALRGLSLSVQQGEIYGLVGPDGAGKTTAIRIMAGLMKAREGTVRVDGHDPLRDSKSVRGILGYMPQQYSLYGDLSIEENLSFFASMFDLAATTYAERSSKLLELTRLSRFRNRRADALSGGMYKKLALSCALLHRPKLLLLDEPTNGVDPVSRREFWDLLRGFADDSMAVLLSTPYMDEASRCHRVGLVHEGRILDEGVPMSMLRGFEHDVYQASGGDRGHVIAVLSGHPGVIGVSPSGSRVRLVVRRDARDSIRDAANALGTSLQPTAPDFEDLFLARMGQGA